MAIPSYPYQKKGLILKSLHEPNLGKTARIMRYSLSLQYLEA